MYVPPITPTRHRARRLTALVTLAVMGLAVPSLAQTDPAAPPPAEAPAPAPAPEAPAPAPEATAPAAPEPAAAPKAKKKRTAAQRKAAARKAAARRAAARKAAARKAATKKKSTAATAKPTKVPRGSALIDIDISSQTMRIYKGGKLYRTVPVSTGSGKRYCEKGRCGTAVTPRGTYRIYNYIRGWRIAPLGKLYNPLYFKGGYAIHGGRLPGYPASHGCVRVSYSVANWLPSVAGVGSTVRIHN
jgi:lipoprotein-anchoring transpeptidase ErfK/SrfK